ncbi:MAG: SH3 domain-containing protein [Stellaceae bacterium]
MAAAVLAAAPLALNAQTPGGDQLPRFASLRSDEINLRVGPGENYPIEWVYQRKDLPVEIIEEFQNWRRIEDWQGTKGWVLDRMLIDKREVIVDGAVQPLHGRPDTAAPIIARAEPGVVARLLACGGAWCRIEAAGYSGWVKRSEIWGVLPDETVQ